MMTDFPSDLGHWERLAEGANATHPDRPIDLHTFRQDACRALLDLHHIEASYRLASQERLTDEHQDS